MWKKVLKIMLDALRVATWQTAPPRADHLPDLDKKRQR